MCSNNDTFFILTNNSYHVTIISNNESISDDEYEDDEEEVFVNDTELNIFDDEHPWDTLHERTYRHRPDIWLYGCDPIYDMT